MRSTLIFLYWMLLVLSSCSDDSTEPLPFLEVKADTLVLKSGAVSRNIEVIATGPWVATVSEDCDWCHCEVNEGVLSFVRVEVDDNKQVDERWTTVTVGSSGLSRSFRVCQFGSAPAIVAVPASFGGLGYEPSAFLLQVFSNVEVEVSQPDSVNWIVKQKEEPGDTLRVYYKTTLNNSVLPRETVLTLRQKDGSLTRYVTVRQNGHSGDYELLSPEGIQKDSKLKVSEATASSFQPGSEAAKSIDGDMNTLYHSNWNNGGENYFPITLEYRLAPEATQLDYLIYYPRTEGNNGRFKEVEVLYCTRENPDYVSLGTVDFKGSASPTKVDFPGGVKDPAGVRFVVHSGTGDGQGFASCAEMEFYRKVDVDASLTAVFTDNTFSALREGVTYEQILAIENEFCRNIARHLYLGTYPAAERVKEYEAWSDPDWIAGRYKINPYNRLDNATGIFVNAGDNLVIFCGDAPGKQLGLTVMDWENGYVATNYMLLPGINQLTMSSNGLAYVMYYDSDPENAPKVKIHIATGKVNGLFTLGKNTDAEWDGLLSGAASTFMDIQGERTHMVMPVSAFRNYVTQPTELLRTYDRMVELEHELMGLFKYNIPIKNRMFFHSITTKDSYMYATSYRTAYHENTLSDILDVSKMKSGATVWGPAHEVGHMHQTRPGLKWIGMTEVTNNIHSLYVQTTFGARSRLIAEVMEDQLTNRYEKAFTEIIAAEKAHDEPGDVFCKVVPFWQLQLYAARIAGKPDFYPDLHEYVRNTPDPTGDTRNGECQMNFVMKASELLETDLTDFFQAWGFLSEIDRMVEDYATERMTVTADMIRQAKERMSRYPKPALGGLIYLNDDNVGLFEANRPIVAGTASHDGQQVTLSGWENVVAYELWEDGRMVLVRQRTSFPVSEGIDWTKAEIRAVAADGTKVTAAFN